MSAPAGPCEWCGGPQLWTVIRGELCVSCRRGCLPLPLDTVLPDLGCGGAAGHGTELAGDNREGSEAEASVVPIDQDPCRMQGSVHHAVDQGGN